MNKNIIRSAFLAVLALLLMSPAHARSEGQEIRNVVVIGWDGAERSRTRELLEKRELPNLAALVKEGRLLDIDVITGATDTKAGWAQLLTGYVPEKTGVYNNGRYEPIPEGYTVFERLEKFFGPDQIDTVAVISKKANVGNDAPYRGTLEDWMRLESKRSMKVGKKTAAVSVVEQAVHRKGGRIVEKDGRHMVEIPGKPWYHAGRHCDVWINGLGEGGKLVERVIAELEKRKDRRFFFFIHFAEPDHLGHAFGENSQEYADGFRLDDRYSGLIIDKLKTLGLYQKTLIYVIADHGFDKGKRNHLYAPFVFAGTNDATVVRSVGTREDIAPTILKRFGLDLSRIEPRLDGYPFDIDVPIRKASPELTDAYRRQYNAIDH